MKVAVTAANGNLGTAIVKQLVREIDKEQVVGIARTPSKANHLGVEVRKGDYNSQSDFEAALRDVEVVQIVSGMDAPDKRIVQHRNIIRAAVASGVRKIVYSSIVGKEGNSTFDPIVRSNRQTEKDIMESGLQWSIGRNGLYIEPDVNYIEQYKKEGMIANCAGEGLCSYTTRDELAYAYCRMILDDDRNGQLFNLAGEPITQQQLTEFLNRAFSTQLVYEPLTAEAYLEIQKKTNGEFLGNVIAGIYHKISIGEFNIASDYRKAAGRDHLGWDVYFGGLKKR